MGATRSRKAATGGLDCPFPRRVIEAGIAVAFFHGPWDACVELIEELD